MSTTTHYDVLGVAEDAAYAEIRSSYLSSLLALHPDKQQQNAPLSSARFLRLQEAWDALRHPQSRSSYDRHLASSRLFLDASVAEDVLLEEMNRDCEEAEAEATYMYPCRCGDFFAVSSQELDDLGFCREPIKQDERGSCRRTAFKDDFEEQASLTSLQDRNIPDQDQHQRTHHSRSLILPCGSCSLHIRLLF
eukprot:c17577_g1_i1 orf=58-636(+)